MLPVFLKKKPPKNPTWFLKFPTHLTIKWNNLWDFTVFNFHPVRFLQLVLRPCKNPHLFLKQPTLINEVEFQQIALGFPGHSVPARIVPKSVRSCSQPYPIILIDGCVLLFLGLPLKRFQNPHGGVKCTCGKQWPIGVPAVFQASFQVFGWSVTVKESASVD